MQSIIERVAKIKGVAMLVRLLTERHVALFFVYLGVRVFISQPVGTVGVIDARIGQTSYAIWCLLWAVLHYNCFFANHTPSLSFRSILVVVFGLLPFAFYIGITFEVIASRNGPPITPELYVWLIVFLGEQLGSGVCSDDRGELP